MFVPWQASDHVPANRAHKRRQCIPSMIWMLPASHEHKLHSFSILSAIVPLLTVVLQSYSDRSQTAHRLFDLFCQNFVKTVKTKIEKEEKKKQNCYQIMFRKKGSPKSFMIKYLFLL